MFHGNKRTEERLKGAKKMIAIKWDERRNETVFRETATTTVATSNKKEQNSLSTNVQYKAREEHCPVIMYLPETYIKTLKIDEGKGQAEHLANKLFAVLMEQDC